MAFWGEEFTFDGIPSSFYGLVVYDFDSNKQEDVTFKSGTIVDEKIQNRFDSLFYGLTQNEPLEFTLVFGANCDSIDAGSYVDRLDIEAISMWLTGHNSRKWLTIIQDDMETYRYKCIITDLKVITYQDYPWAFSCKVTCDSPFGYTFPEDYIYDVNGKQSVRFFNRSSYNGFHRPKIEIKMKGAGNFSIENESDYNRLFKFTNLPATSSLTINVDNQNQIITNNAGLNLYPNFNMRFLRLVPGDNYLNIIGDAVAKITCEFPVNVGG